MHLPRGERYAMFPAHAEDPVFSRSDHTLCVGVCPLSLSEAFDRKTVGLVLSVTMDRDDGKRKSVSFISNR